MKIKNKNKYLLLVFIALIVMSFAYGEIEIITYDSSTDFSLSTSNSINNCACTQTKDYLTITNTGSFTTTFYIESRLPISNKVIELLPGESKQVEIYIQSDCNPKIKTETITVKSNTGMVKTIEKEIRTERCQNLELRIKPTETIKSCQEAKYTIFIRNIGAFTEEYSLKSNLDKYMSYSEKYVTLQPNQIAEINASLKLPCNVYGEKKVEFTAYSINNKLEAKITSTLNILPDYDYEVLINNEKIDENTIRESKTQYRQSLEVCNRVWYTEFPITIVNNGIENTFTIDFNNLPKFVTIKGIEDNNYRFSLSKGESKTFLLIVDSHKFRSEEKGYDFSVIVRPSIGKSTEKRLRINLKPCYEHEIKIIDDSTEKNPINVCSEGFYEYDVQVKNNGIYDENIRLSIKDAPSNVELSRNIITISPKNSETVKLYIIGPETNYLYNIKVVAELDNQIQEQDNIWIKANDKQTCHNIIFKKSLYKINYDKKYIDIPIISEALYPDFYTIVLNDTQILKTEEQKIYIDKNNKKTENIRLYLNTIGLPEGEYNVRLTLEHLSGAYYNNDLKIVLKDKSPIVKAFEYFFYGTECRKVSLLEVFLILGLCILLIVFLIIGPHYPYKLKNRIKQKIIVLIVLSVIFIIATLLVVLLTDKPKNLNDVYGLNTSITDLRFEILENDKYIIDASKLFKDPDNNKLRYTVSEIKNVKTRVKDNNIILQPEKGWSGTRTFTITAYDDQGGEIESPEMTLKVIDIPRKSIIELYEIYCWYSNLFLLLIMLFLIFVAFIVKQRKRTRK
ncbi:MAG: hypothetical protein KatS3mg002_0193 [Candidatus Woesearchaeota archaeon]|nr:MAG: hypothetical protein KatS3mg002_0193 [Candidatus Woesearchaeota archaeon]